MYPNNKDTSLETLKEIRSIMDRSARFLSLSGWSGIWAGCTALAGAGVAYNWLLQLPSQNNTYKLLPSPEQHETYATTMLRFLILAIIVFIVALAGGYFFTQRRAKEEGQPVWNTASKLMFIQIAIPLVAGSIFSLGFLYYGHVIYIAPACLVFYGLALINGSKYTISDIRYLGLLEVTLGCINQFLPGYGLYFWAVGFGILHILYGIIMWNKYEKKRPIVQG
ncbi:MAG TPA: hypothetical protein VN721_09630 [Flavipsychrobacter sp.]|nr:hypothetical protein [Flavipsychrobacter sp.]